MMGFDEALQVVLGLGEPLALERVRLDDACQRVLAVPVAARNASPPVNVSAMDGYAVRDADLRAGEVTLKLAGDSRAGQAPPGPLAQGTCLRVFTGAPTPSGASRVVIQEDVQRAGEFVTFSGVGRGRTHIRSAGSDFRAGAILLEAGTVLDAPRMVALAAADVGEVMVWARPRVRLMATGDEIREPGGLGEGIPDSVSFGVAALVRQWGGVVVGRSRHADDLAALEQAASRALDEADIVVVSGGASVGEHDLARAMFAPLGLHLDVDKVAIKPGKPVWVGRCQGKLIVGLPGNPTSAMVTARLLLAPLIAKMAGPCATQASHWKWELLAGDLPCCGERETFVRAARSPQGIVPVGNQDAAAQAALARCDALIRQVPGERAKIAGEPVLVMAF